MKKLLIVITAFFALFPLAVTDTYAAYNYHNDTPVNTEKSGINDNYGFFDSDELVELNVKIQETAEKLDMNIYVFTAGPSYRYNDPETESFANNYYDELFGKDTDGVFYFMDFAGGETSAYDYISTSGKAVLLYENHISSIFNSINKYLPPSTVDDYKPYADDVYKAIEVFLDELVNYSGSETHGYYYDESSGKYFYYKDDELIITKSPPLQKRMIVLLISMPAGVISAFIFYFATKHKYKFKSSENPRIYVDNGKTNFTQRSDTFIRTYTTKEKIQRNDDSHSGGGGGGGGGGHGGGGSHR